MSNWKEILRHQEEDLHRMEQMDAALNEDEEGLDYDINAILKGKTSISTNHRSRSTSDMVPDSPKLSARDKTHSRRGSSRPSDDIQEGLYDMHLDDVSYEDPPLLSSRSEKSMASPSSSSRPTGSGRTNSPHAPDTAARIQKAKLKALTKQLEDSKDMRKKLMEQVNDLQRQLKSERDENKLLNKRVQLLEAENRRSGAQSKRGAANPADELAELRAENANLKKDLQTAERLAKQAESQTKTKDTHLKRALETISRNKSTIEELQLQAQNGGHSDKAKLDEALTRVRLLEKHREELLDAFRKQMKLIDVLKRQKTHIEAARLLQFTEEEFVKTLDW
eukprot:CAMPEP_0185023840 /NCGR_PEP_ID=MMETSP1103-20130426/6467_1 /TAXON_ID=36769 /ORGANISM="Paraphysomonas bandaiensis, Strain Caron Lab Isolate" /LENGTH=335 /DNA_ID=CAMNT_0027556607 /DNA_START=66 /DNA_END=1070 /DNA_ORIENTATION=+